MDGKRIALAIVIFLLTVFVFTGCGQTAVEPKPEAVVEADADVIIEEDTVLESETDTNVLTGSFSMTGQELIQVRCSSCHDLNKVFRDKNADQWPMTVDRMINKGAVLNVQERDQVIDYLQTNYSK